MSIITTETGQSYEVNVDSDGWIRLWRYGHYGENRLSQAEAAELAAELLDAIRKSQDRNQMASWSYYDTENIERRANSKLGIAQAAARNIFK